jgi:hypothetical protein
MILGLLLLLIVVSALWATPASAWALIVLMATIAVVRRMRR